MSASTSNVAAKLGKYDFVSLPKEMHGMKIKEDRSDDKDFEATLVNGNSTEVGQIIVTSIGGRNGKLKQTFSYMAERVAGTGSFGVVFQAKCLETGDSVAIKKAYTGFVSPGLWFPSYYSEFGSYFLVLGLWVYPWRFRVWLSYEASKV
ncbi:putative protein-serine/threonine kinase [Helianthus anomalus]